MINYCKVDVNFLNDKIVHGNIFSSGMDKKAPFSKFYFDCPVKNIYAPQILLPPPPPILRPDATTARYQSRLKRKLNDS